MEKFLGDRVELRPGDCREIIKAMPDCSVDSVVTDPPYALVSIGKRFGRSNMEQNAEAQPPNRGAQYKRLSKGFMGKQWDTGETAFASEFWAEVYRVLKPGGHVGAFSGTRTYHRMAVAIEDAGFEIRDQLAWMYGSGFPKSHDVSKGIAKKRTEDVEPTRAVCRFIRAAMDDAGLKSKDLTHHFDDCNPRLIDHWAARDSDSQPAMPTDEQWAVLADVLTLAARDDFAFVAGEVARLNERKGTRGERWLNAEVIGEVESTPAGFGDVRFGGDRTIRSLDDSARQWQGWGTALKPAWEPICLARKPLIGTVAANVLEHGTGALNIDGCRVGTEGGARTEGGDARTESQDGAIGAYKSSPLVPGPGRWPANIVHDGSDEVLAGFPDSDGQRGIVDGQTSPRDVYGEFGPRPRMDPRLDSGSAARFFYTAKADGDDRLGSKHPTVKPVDLMQWLCRLITPLGGLVLDPFAGTGTTGEAAYLEGFRAILIEREEEYQADIRRRMGLVISSSDARRQAASANKPKSTDMGIFEGLE